MKGVAGVARIDLVDLQALDRELGPELRAAVDRVARSGSFILGQTVASFERALASHCGVPHAVGVASGTDALALALMAAGVEPGDRVITTPLSFIATAEAILRVGAAAHFVDVDEERLCLSAAAVERVLARCQRDRHGRLVEPVSGDRMGAILPVHLYGRVADVPALASLAREAGLPLIEDAAQAIGARVDGRALGQDGAACLSFFPTKNLGGWGDGGAVLTADGTLAEQVRALRVHGASGPGTYAELGFNSRLDAIQAAVLEVKLGHLDGWSERRRGNAERYGQCLAEAELSPWVAAPPALRDGDLCHLYTVQVRGDSGGEQRAALQAHLAAAGIGSAVYYPQLLCDQPAIAARLTAPPDALPVARAATGRLLSLPVHESLAEGSVERVVEAMAAHFATA
ncbi:MAG: DegT/DnrJ/EryC1/StrS family aminotransferase [Deltaproteobacteria bacterium]|nr:DegT/DnrJ/EryC1/StrS family aminotransferase [Deltaproteobacteria bacterium]